MSVDILKPIVDELFAVVKALASGRPVVLAFLSAAHSFIDARLSQIAPKFGGSEGVK